MKILFATPECAPYVKTGGLGDVSAALPAALVRLGHDVRVLLPAYRGMKVSGEVGDTIELPAHSAWPAAQVLPVRLESGVTLLLLACPSLYHRAGGPYVDADGTDYHDNALRFGLLSRVAALFGTPQSPDPTWQAEVVHANDWPSALAPLYLAQHRAAAPNAHVAASVMTIHNIAFQGVFPYGTADLLEIPHALRSMDGVEFWGQLSMLKAGLQFADAITTVSPTYAREIQTETLGAGLDGVLRARSQNLRGILNGIDTHVWNPQTDPLLPHRYGPDEMGGKAKNKTELQRRCNFAPDARTMLFGVVSRLTMQKGIDLILGHLDQLVASGAQLVVLGQGEPRLQQALLEAAGKYPASVNVSTNFDESLAHLIEAGVDCFLMPSRFEPCGLNQMYSQAYGTPPLVSPTGGLLDSVVDVREVHGSGFVMSSIDSTGFAEAFQRSLTAWQDPPTWRAIQLNGMRQDLSWNRSALDYSSLYESVVR